MSENKEDEIENDWDDDLYELSEPSFILLAIDTHPSMFVKMNDNELTTFEICFRACNEIADSLLLRKNTRNSSPFGIILANTDDANKSTFIDFNTNMIDTVKMLKKINQCKLDELIQNYQRKDLKSFDLSGFFLSCKKKFTDIKSEYADKVIIYITNDDNPIGDDKNRRFTALNEAKNFAPNDIQFEMVTMNKDFNYSLFYNELFSLISSSSPIEDATKDIDEQFIENEDGMNEKLTNSIVSRYYQRKLKFYIDKNDTKRFLRVIQKKYISSSKLYNNYCTTTAGKPAKKITVSSADDEQHTLDSDRGNVEFTLSEYRELHSTDLPVGYTLIYVTKRVTDMGCVLGKTVILESDLKEGLPYFGNVWKYCVAKNSVLVCARRVRENDKIRFVELIPKFINNKSTYLVKLIPFANEIDYPPGYFDPKNPSASIDEQLRFVDEFVKSLTCEYNPEMFPSVSHAKKERYLKANLLDEDESNEEIKDMTIMTEAIKERAAEIAKKFKKSSGPEAAAGSSRERAPEAAPDAAPEAAPDAAPEAAPDAAPEAAAAPVPEPEDGPPPKKRARRSSFVETCVIG